MRDMTWLEGNGRDQKPAGDRLWELLQRPRILGVPGAHNGLAGQLAKKAGFEALYISGGALTASMAYPDLGMMTVEELCFFTRIVYRATGLPLIVDGDTGYGEVLNVMRTVRELETAGAAAVQIEDQMLPKKCGHLNDKRLVAPEEMAAKVAAARRARSHLRIIARTDAAAVEGVEAAIARARLYAEAGADIIFADALVSEADFRAFGEAFDVPLMANMTEFGRTPFFTAQEFEDFGFDIVIWPATSMRMAGRALEELYAHIQDHGSTEGLTNRMLTRGELYEVIGYHDYEALDAGIAKTVLPTPGE